MKENARNMYMTVPERLSGHMEFANKAEPIKKIKFKKISLHLEHSQFIKNRLLSINKKLTQELVQ